MKWYLAVGAENTVSDPMVVDDGDLIGIDESMLLLGNMISDWQIPSLRVSTQKNEGTPDDALQNHLGLPIFSERLQKALVKENIGGIQYLPVRISHFNGEELESFAIANVIEKRQALSLEDSVYEVFSEDFPIEDRRGRISGLWTPVLRLNALSDCDVLRLVEYPVALFLSERIREIFHRTGCTGLGFHEVRVI